jgi:Zn-dependent peptidase ImmA (M78 family)
MIKINGERWRVRLVPPSHPILTYKTGRPAFGCCDDISKTIFINQTLPLSQIKKVLCHEMVHAAMYSYNVDLTEDTEEIVADIIATYGAEIIRLTNATYDKIK